MAGVSIFNLINGGGKIEEFLVCFIAVVIFTLMVELIVERVEHWQQKRDHYIRLITSTLTKELMILGIISFSIFMCEQTFGLQNASFYIELELAHVIIFFIAVFLVLNTIQ
eukprot:g7097.t1